MSDESNEWVWKFFETDYKVFCPTREVYDKMIRWKGARPGGFDQWPNGAREYYVILPEDLADRASALLREYLRSEDQKSATNPTLNNNDLRQSGSR